MMQRGQTTTPEAGLDYTCSFLCHLTASLAAASLEPLWSDSFSKPHSEKQYLRNITSFMLRKYGRADII